VAGIVSVPLGKTGTATRFEPDIGGIECTRVGDAMIVGRAWRSPTRVQPADISNPEP
jgi:hypothetical protein